MLSRIIPLGIILALVLSVATWANANNGQGSPDFCERHGCNVPTACPDPAPCPVVEPCTEQPVCPDLVCNGTTLTVAPTAFPNYRPCKRKKSGKLVCPAPKRPQRVLVPSFEGN